MSMDRIRERVRGMESILEEQSAFQADLQKSLEAIKTSNEHYIRLRDYYGSEEMDEDLAADDAGALDDLKRGVLTEDAVYNLMGDRYELGLEMLKVAHMLLKHY